MPIALSIPDGVSHIRGVGLPRHAVCVIDLTMTPPSAERSTSSGASRPAAYVPDATSTGVFSATFPSFTSISAIVSVPRGRELVDGLVDGGPARGHTGRR